MAGVLSNKIGREELKAGDHIYSWRCAYIYSHHGIYTGDEKVIHFTCGGRREIGTGTALDGYISSSSSNTICANCGDQSSQDGVVSSCLDCFLSNGNLYRVKYSVSTLGFLVNPRGGTSTLADSDPPKDVLDRAEYLLRNGFGEYHVVNRNCEDFAIYCKTGLAVKKSSGRGQSGQVASLGAAFGAALGAAAIGITTYLVSRYICDTGVRRDVMKIPVEELMARDPKAEHERELESVSEMANVTYARNDKRKNNPRQMLI